VKASADQQDFIFGSYQSSIHIISKLPLMENISADFGRKFFKPLLICDTNTKQIAENIIANNDIPLCVLPPGEQNKNWQTVESIINHAVKYGIGRDGIFIGVGGGVICDLSAFAASIYMRGCPLALIPTTLLAMADAAIGGKTGFDLFGIKNLAGTFYPARHIYLAPESMISLPLPEWKSGMAELIKTAVLDGDDFMDELASIASFFPEGSFTGGFPVDFASCILDSGNAEFSACLQRAVKFKGGIVEEDPLETGSRRILLNLGHTFGHALETTAGLGNITHGEAVAWGIARSCELGLASGFCPPWRAEKIKTLLATWGFDTRAPHPLMGQADVFIKALGNDKKKRNGNITFIVPGEKSAVPVVSFTWDTIDRIINGAFTL